MAPPYTLKIRYKDESSAHERATFPGARRTGDWELAFGSDDLWRSSTPWAGCSDGLWRSKLRQIERMHSFSRSVATCTLVELSASV
jgi:hypothetical protein